MIEYVRVAYDFQSFDFWGGARDRIAHATDEQKEKVKERIEEYFDDGMDYCPTETEINDLVWFECDDIFFDEGEEDDD